MKNLKINYLKNTFLLGLVIITSISCERVPSEEASYATSPTTAEIFTDTPIGMGSNFYFPYAPGPDNPVGSKLTAWTVDSQVSYSGSSSMRFDVPNGNDPKGNYAGGIFRVDGAGRDLTGYDALTFWAKATQNVSINEIGFGEDFYPNKYITTMRNVSITTNWVKYIIPIPDASKLVNERGMLRYAAGGIGTEKLGYTFWIDELKFEKLGTIGQPRPKILKGLNIVEQTFIGSTKTLTDLTQTFNMADGLNQTVSASPSYFAFTSSDPSVATVSELGVVNVIGAGSTVITAKLGGKDASGSLTLNSLGVFTPAPTPTRDAANVISIFSDKYTNVPVEYYNGYWAPYQTTQGQADININGDNIIKYSQFNFVGTQFAQPTVNASQMTHLHLDVQVQNTTGIRNAFKIAINDFGADGTYGGGNDTGQQLTITNPNLPSGTWVSFDLPLSNFTGLTSRAHLAQIVLESSTGITDILLDNVYFYAVPTAPNNAAPTPTVASTNVVSVFSDAYTNIASNLNPAWGQSTIVTQVPIAGNNTLKYTGFNYQGIEFTTNQNLSTMTNLHLDYYSANSTSLKVYLISPGPVEKSKILTVPTTAGWNSVEIQMSDFSPVVLSNISQMKFDGNGTIYLDNIYFHN
jgi:hypothetical protein